MSEEFDSSSGQACGHAVLASCGGLHPAILFVAAILLVVLGLVIGMAVARMVAEDERRKAAVAIYQAVYEEIALALAAYGGSTVPAAAKLAVTLRMALGPVLTLAGSVAGPLKQIDTAVKGKTKEKPHGAHASGAGGQSQAAAGGPVAQQQIIINAATGEVAAAGGGGSSSSAHGEAEREMTAAEQQDEARHGIEAIAAFWVQRNVVSMILEAGEVLLHPKVKPRLLSFSSSASSQR